MNVSGLRKKLRKRLEAGTKPTKELTLNSWCEKRAGEENAGTPEPRNRYIVSEYDKTRLR